MSKKSEESPIQYRPGEAFCRVLADLSQQWQITRNDGAKRLALLAAFSMDIRHYADVAKLADLIGGIHGFEAACRQIFTAIETEICTRNKLRQKVLDENDRFKLIQQIAGRGVLSAEVTATEHQQVMSRDMATEQLQDEVKDAK